MRRVLFFLLSSKRLYRPLLISCLATLNAFVIIYSISSRVITAPAQQVNPSFSRHMATNIDSTELMSSQRNAGSNTSINTGGSVSDIATVQNLIFGDKSQFTDNGTKRKHQRIPNFKFFNRSAVHNHGSKSMLVSYFLPRNTKYLEEQFRDMLAIFDQLLSEKGVAYFLYGGSLLGSYRHHGLIPWDDDVDVMISLAQRPMVHDLLKRLLPTYEFSAHKACSWKMYSVSALPVQGLSWKWPYLDIFFYQENATHIWDVCASYISQFSFRKSAVFPLRRRPFLGLSVPAPHDPKAVIENNYTIETCQSNTFVHRWEIVKDPVSVSCSSLHSIHPFVSRTFTNGGCNETLLYQGMITNVFFDWGFTC